jgi:hypothetical protein
LAEHWDLPNTGIFFSKDVAFKEKDTAAFHKPSSGRLSRLIYRAATASFGFVALNAVILLTPWSDPSPSAYERADDI